MVYLAITCNDNFYQQSKHYIVFKMKTLINPMIKGVHFSDK